MRLGLLYSHAQTFHPIAFGARLAADRLGCKLIVSTTLEAFQTSNVDGLLLGFNYAQGEELEKARSLDLPIITISRSHPDFDAVITGDRGAMKQAVRHLADAGHGRIAFVTGAPNQRTEARFTGYREGLAAMSIEFDPDLVVGLHYAARSSGQMIGDLLEQQIAFTAVIASTDVAALGVYDALNRAGLRIPDDVAVVGYNNDYGSAFLEPPLTTFDGMPFEVAYRATVRLIERIQNRRLPVQEIVVKSRMIVRESCGLTRRIAEKDETFAVAALVQALQTETSFLNPETPIAEATELVQSLTNMETCQSKLRTSLLALVNAGDHGDGIERIDDSDSVISLLRSYKRRQIDNVKEALRWESFFEEERKRISRARRRKAPREIQRDVVRNFQQSFVKSQCLDEVVDSAANTMEADEIPWVGFAFRDPLATDRYELYLRTNDEERRLRVRKRSAGTSLGAIFSKLAPEGHLFVVAMEFSGYLIVPFSKLQSTEFSHVTPLFDFGVRLFRMVESLTAQTDDLRMAREQAVAASKTKSEFLANMSHEIRTPMNGVLGMTELVLQTNITLQQKEYLEMAHASATTLLTVINDILDFSKIEAGKLDLSPAPFVLRDCVGDTVKTLGLRAEQKGLELFCHIDPTAPETVLVDGGRLRQILVNLVGNAIKFTKKGEVLVDVTVNAVNDTEVELLFAIKDTGPGIPPEKLELIFHAFEQADGSTSREFGGTGLGLAISTKLVQQMHGRLWVESEVGEGSIFKFTVCLAIDHEYRMPEKLRLSDLVGLRTLVVDDNATNRTIVAEILTSWSMRPELASGGIEAINALWRANSEKDPCRLLLLDAMMPMMDGFDLARQIQAIPEFKSITVMMLSSGLPSAQLQRCGELGIRTMLSKPITQSDLLDAILNAVALDAGGCELPPTLDSSLTPAKSLAILIVEDNEVNRIVACGLLEKRGHRITAVENGLLAVEAVAHSHFDLVLMDVQMPVMDGYSATAEIRRAEKEEGRERLRIVAMTAHAMRGDRERCLASKMDDYIAKPIVAEELFKVVEQSPARTGGAIDEGKSKPCPEQDGQMREVDPHGNHGLDIKALFALTDGDSAFMSEILDTFLKTAPELATELEEAVRCADALALCSAAHALRNSCLPLGATTAVSFCQTLEVMGQTGNMIGSDTLINALQEQLRSLLAQVSGHLKRV